MPAVQEEIGGFGFKLFFAAYIVGIRRNHHEKKNSGLLFFLVVFVAPSVVGQNPNYKNGAVWRVIHVDVKPGMGDAFWTDVRQNFKPIYDEFKNQGWVLDYKFFTNPVAQHPDDWSVAITIEYKDWATLDEMGEKAAAVAESTTAADRLWRMPPRSAMKLHRLSARHWPEK